MAVAVDIDLATSPEPWQVGPRQLALVPNVLSLARIPLALVFARAVASSRCRLALSALLAAGATDVADGWCARKLGQETAIGRLVDPAADKFFFGTATLALASAGRIRPLTALLLATREIGQLGLGLGLMARGNLLATSASTRSTITSKMTTLLQVASVGSTLFAKSARKPLIVATAFLGAIAGAQYWARSKRASGI